MLTADASSGSGQAKISNTARASWPAISPDGKRVAFELNEGFELDVINTDGTGKRFLASSQGGQIAWSPDGRDIVFEKGFPQKLHVVNGPDGLPIEQISSSGTVLYLHHDQQGSTRLLTGSAGAKEASFTYDAYGNQTGRTGTATTPLGYDAQYTSQDTGLIYLRARTYDPATAQFLSVDPILSITREPYTYAGDNPTRHGDRTGLGSGFEAELPEGVPCILPFCVPPSVHEGFENAFESVEHSAEMVWNAINENEGPNDEGEQALREDREREEQCGNELAREGERLLGRRHSPAAKQRFQEWFEGLSKSDRDLYKRYGGPRPRRRT